MYVLLEKLYTNSLLLKYVLILCSSKLLVWVMNC